MSNPQRGNGKVTFKSQTLLARGDIKHGIAIKPNAVESGLAGTAVWRNGGQSFKVSFESMGHIAPLVALLQGYGGTSPMYPGTELSDDSPLVVHTTDNVKMTWRNAVLTDLPTINLTTQQTLGGTFGFDCLCKSDLLPDDEDAFYTLDESGGDGFTLPDLALSDAPSQLYTLSLYDGLSIVGAPFNGLKGAQLAFKLSKEDEPHDARGPMSRIIFKDIMCELSLIPAADIEDTENFESWLYTMMRLQDNSGAKLGANLGNGYTLRIDGNGLFIRLHAASIINNERIDSSTLRRQGTIKIVSDRRNGSSGVLGSSFYIGTTQPAAELD